ncbi:hypothetical protein CR513_13515, partial [Mucuna pruriens]
MADVGDAAGLFLIRLLFIGLLEVGPGRDGIDLGPPVLDLRARDRLIKQEKDLTKRLENFWFDSSNLMEVSWKGREKERPGNDSYPKKGSNRHEGGKKESESSQEENTSSSESEASNDHTSYEGDLLMVRRLMSSMVPGLRKALLHHYRW